VGRTAPCADTNGDGQVDVDDLLNLLGEFGMSSLTTDIDDSGTVDVADLMLVLADFGTFVDEIRTSCVAHGPAEGRQGDVCGTVTQISTDGPGTTYRLGLSLSGNAKSVYTIYGDEDFSMVIPPAYQEAAPFGTNTGGVNPAFIPVSASAAFDSWLTVGIVDGDNAGALGSAGFDWETWTMDSGLSHRYRCGRRLLDGPRGGSRRGYSNRSNHAERWIHRICRRPRQVCVRRRLAL
jgi:hypothetical protein